MAGWHRGTTPSVTLNVDIDLREATIFVSFAQRGRVVVEKTGDDLYVTEDAISMHFTQEDTLAFKPGELLIQVRYVMENGLADASNIIVTTAEEILKDGVIRYV